MHVNALQNCLLLGLAISQFQPALTQETPPSQCATGVHAILMRGQGPGDHLNVMVSVQNLVLQLIPGSSSVALPYSHGADDHRVAASNGTYMMQDYIRSYVASCPDSKIFIIGYSLGGVAMMDGLCGTSSQWLFKVPAIEPHFNQNVIAAVSYGEETYVPGLSYDHGTCTDGTGIYPRIHPEWCDPFLSSIRSYCDEGDGSCCFRFLPPITDPAHFLYIFRYNMEVIQFVQQRLKATQSQ
ncbi:uncharacterized protein N7496_011126 [Penicillium cataractarum]|uniref:Uncharacterized protein n=1 Tax=Penicillium cataractarum TaxID=2100454 RepID=A0A9W9RED7_9EURO|nr:uncharacterized protein N7496_011126 [Penicillium cataractarum]KAJ5358713.1 hypothetical protein N7496_011126 [Penicillium cataractarum]